MLELIGILGGFFVFAAALWGLRVAAAVVLGHRRARRWIRLLAACIGGACLYWTFAELAAPHGASLGIIARRSLVLLDFGIVIACADAIARITGWVDKHASSALT
jgi:hypothetical protein